MTRFKKTLLIIVTIAGTGWFVHHRNNAKRSLAEQIRGVQHTVDWIAFVGLSDWRHDHHAGCDQTVVAFHHVLGSLNDEWNHHFRGACSNSRLTVTSAGPDGVFGTADDIASNLP